MSKSVFSKAGSFVSKHPLAIAAGAFTTVHEVKKGKRVTTSLAKGAAVTTGAVMVPAVAGVVVKTAVVAAPMFAAAAISKSIGNGLFSLLMTSKEREAHFKQNYCLQRYLKAKTKKDSDYWLQEAMKASEEFSQALKAK